MRERNTRRKMIVFVWNVNVCERKYRADFPTNGIEVKGESRVLAVSLGFC